MADSIQSVRSFLPSPHSENAHSAPVTPSRRMPTIDRSKVNPEILKAAEGMEAMFIDTMMRVMRQSVPKNEMDLESPATEIYRGMLDSEFAQKAAHHLGTSVGTSVGTNAGTRGSTSGLGLADQIIAYLDSQGYNSSHGAQGKDRVPMKEKP